MSSSPKEKRTKHCSARSPNVHKRFKPNCPLDHSNCLQTVEFPKIYANMGLFVQFLDLTGKYKSIIIT